MQRRYIAAVKPLEEHILQVDFVSGSRMLLDLKPVLRQIRFRPLTRPEIWRTADTNGIFVRIGPVELSLDEIFELAERPGQEDRG